MAILVDTVHMNTHKTILDKDKDKWKFISHSAWQNAFIWKHLGLISYLRE